jgi:hypothetical protein
MIGALPRQNSQTFFFGFLSGALAIPCHIL